LPRGVARSVSAAANRPAVRRMRCCGVCDYISYSRSVLARLARKLLVGLRRVSNLWHNLTRGRQRRADCVMRLNTECEFTTNVRRRSAVCGWLAVRWDTAMTISRHKRALLNSVACAPFCDSACWVWWSGDPASVSDNVTMHPPSLAENPSSWCTKKLCIMIVTCFCILHICVFYFLRVYWFAFYVFIVSHCIYSAECVSYLF